MSTAFNISKDKIGWYYEQARDTSGCAIILMLAKATGLEADGVLADYTNIGSLWAASNNECDFTNYVRKTLIAGSVIKTIDDSGNRVLLDLSDPTWVEAGGNPVSINNTIGKVIIAFDPNTSIGTDTSLVPLNAHDITATTDGNDLVIRFHTDGAVRVL